MNINQVRKTIEEARVEAAAITAHAERLIAEKKHEEAFNSFRKALSAQKTALRTADDFLASLPNEEQSGEPESTL